MTVTEVVGLVCQCTTDDHKICIHTGLPHQDQLHDLSALLLLHKSRCGHLRSRKVHSSAHSLRYMANNPVIFYNSNSEIIMAVFWLLLQGKNFFNSSGPFPAMIMITTNERSPLKRSAPSDELTGHKVRKRHVFAAS